MNKVPSVSVVMITYNQENYIEQAILGVLMQECNFKIELIIADDCSQDNTEKIVNKIIENHTNGKKIQYTRHSTNKGMNNNFIWAASQAIGKYIALCEGDDYWTDPLKLQKQVDFLEANEEYTLCFHNSYNLLKNNEIKLAQYTYNKDQNRTFDRYDLALKNFIQTPTVLFRNVIKSYPDWMTFSPVGDYVLWHLIAKHGKIYYLKDIMATYRVGVGVISSINNTEALIMFMQTITLLKIEFRNDKKLLKNLDKQLKSKIERHNSTIIYEFSNDVEAIKNNISIFKMIRAIFLRFF